ncbi:MAG: hypothetical protein IJ038_07180 [Clostridia bacterium]|nr:hypothetical protein [Clostridia bacterium]
MYIKIAIEVIAALFAVFGFYSAVRLLAQKIFADDNIFLAVEIKDETAAENAEVLIREALGYFLAAGSPRVAVLVSEELCDDRLMDIVRKYGAECYLIDT